MWLAKSKALQAIIGIILSLVLTGFYLLHYREEEVVRILTQFQHTEKEAFVESSIQTSIEGVFDSQSIKDLCGSKTWTPGLIFQCDSPQGGVGNVENFFLNCIRFAIEAGAAFIVPQIMIRSSKDLSDLTTHKVVDLDYLFDRSHFTTTLTEACPQMSLYDTVDSLYNFPTTATPIVLRPQDLATEFVQGRVLAQPAEWRASFYAFLNSKIPEGISSSSPVIVQLHDVLLEFPLSYDTTAFVRNFARVFRFREDVRRLAGAILFEISTKFSPSLRPTSQIAPNAFFGAHLRTAPDAIKAGWPGYEVQAPALIARAARHHLATIYVSSGYEPDTLRFREDAALQNCTVVTKEDLLSTAEIEELGRLTWDQQALVDFEVLSRSSQFGGIVQSSFSWKIAIKRHLLSMTNDHLRGDQALEDELSVVYGSGLLGGFFPLAMWP